VTKKLCSKNVIQIRERASTEYMPGHTGGNPTSSHSFGGRIWKAVLRSPGTWTTFRQSSAVRITNFGIARQPSRTAQSRRDNLATRQLFGTGMPRELANQLPSGRQPSSLFRRAASVISARKQFDRALTFPEDNSNCGCNRNATKAH